MLSNTFSFAFLACRLPSSGRWSSSSMSTVPQAPRSHGSITHQESSGSQILDHSLLLPPTPRTPRGPRLEAADSLHPHTAMATTIRPKALGQGQGRLGRSNTQVWLLRAKHTGCTVQFEPRPLPWCMCAVLQTGSRRRTGVCLSACLSVLTALVWRVSSSALSRILMT